jgi:hypothetical protein
MLSSTEPTCPPDKIFNKCGPLVPPSCDAPKGKKGCAVGCYCPEGKYLSRCGACVDVCQGQLHANTTLIVLITDYKGCRMVANTKQTATRIMVY